MSTFKQAARLGSQIADWPQNVCMSIPKVLHIRCNANDQKYTNKSCPNCDWPRLSQAAFSNKSTAGVGNDAPATTPESQPKLPALQPQVIQRPAICSNRKNTTWCIITGYPALTLVKSLLQIPCPLNVVGPRGSTKFSWQHPQNQDFHITSQDPQ